MTLRGTGHNNDNITVIVVVIVIIVGARAPTLLSTVVTMVGVYETLSRVARERPV